ncbi:iron chaperone [Marinilactibacillus sp. GCM10026970]|uniref:iron chaperone n=1 Tax=Marinilactibacillus sp. GCM10026970 TaxID=3252642 RepID=UPI0036206A78
METFEDYLSTIDNIEQRDRMTEILSRLQKTFPELVPRIAWNQPNFTDHGTFIMGFSIAKQHISIAPEKKAILQFEAEIKQDGYAMTKELFKIKNSQDIDFELLEKITQYNIEDKKNCETYWRK